MNQKLYLWIEDYLFYPNYFQRLISFVLLPFTLIYILVILTKRVFSKKVDYDIPIISIGNLIVGGSGKTPVCIKLASSYDKVCIILRGYGRKSRGLYVISKFGEILENIDISGDEAMVFAKALPNACVIVCENRQEGIKKAKDLECEVIFLDDGFSKYNIKKFDIILKSKKEPTNNFCLPSGGYRELKSFEKYANLILKEGEDFKRKVKILKEGKEVVLPKKVILLTAISKPKRLLEFLPQDIILKAYPDHYEFKKEDIEDICKNYQGYCILTTTKDFVKLEKFAIKDIHIMDLDIEISFDVFSKIDDYINRG